MAERVRGVDITPIALERLRQIQQERGLEDCVLRLYIAGGCNCSPQVTMAFDQHTYDTDYIFEVDGLRVALDPEALALLEGARVDFVQSPMGEGFTIELAPREVAHEAEHAHEHACGCGGSCGCNH